MSALNAPTGRAPEPGRVILDEDAIGRALRRMAHEIAERHGGVESLSVLGIPTRGVPLATRLADALRGIEGHDVPHGVLDPSRHRDDREVTAQSPEGEEPVPQVTDRVVVLVDDVLHTGRTIRAALDALSALGRPRAVRLAVMVDRGHRELPIRADHVGKNLPTASTERVQVRLREVDQRDAVEILTGRSGAGGTR